MNTKKPKGLKAIRCKLRLDDTWESPPLHILVTAEEDIIVARCLDFTVASHGDTAEEAVESLKEMLSDYVRYYFERGEPERLVRPDDDEYWQLYNRLEIAVEQRKLRRMKSLKHPLVLDRSHRSQCEELVYA